MSCKKAVQLRPDFFRSSRSSIMRRPHLAIAAFVRRIFHTISRGLCQAASRHDNFTTTLRALPQPLFLVRTGVALRDNANPHAPIQADGQQVAAIPLRVLGLTAVERQASHQAHQGTALARFPTSRNHNHCFHVLINLRKCRPAPDTVVKIKRKCGAIRLSGWRF